MEMLIEVDISVLDKGDERSERAKYCDDVVDEFMASGSSCSELTEFEPYGDDTDITGCIRYRADKKGARLKVRQRKGRVFLVRDAE